MNAFDSSARLSRSNTARGSSSPGTETRRTWQPTGGAILQHTVPARGLLALAAAGSAKANKTIRSRRLQIGNDKKLESDERAQHCSDGDGIKLKICRRSVERLLAIGRRRFLVLVDCRDNLAAVTAGDGSSLEVERAPLECGKRSEPRGGSHAQHDE
mmetsp:Transcript_9404/g.31211  ORF Transcript_9404/g.31211 Transcript_9404/m.31211 type:complete len:157 (+) Transcript_9404:799-1269(+)